MAKEIKIPITGDSSQYKKALSEADQASGKFAKSTEGHGKAIAAAGGIAAAAVGAFAADAVSAASDYNETVSKSKVIFGEASTAVIDFAESSASNLGLSAQAALDAEANFAIFGKSAGLAGEDLVNFSGDLTTMAADLGSFHNTSPEQAIEAIGAALRGEAEPIRAYGVLLDDATLRQTAMELGIYDGVGALTQQQKVLAAQKSIFKQTGDAQGDFERTSGGLAGQTKILTAEFENLKVKLGSELIPLVSKLMGFISDVAIGGDASAESFQAITDAMDAGEIHNVVNAFQDLIGETAEARSHFDNVSHSVGNFINQLAGGSAEAIRNFDKAFGDLAAQSPKSAQAVVDALRAVIAAAEDGNPKAQAMVEKYELTNEKLDEMAATLPHVESATLDATSAFEHMGIAQQDATTNAGKTKEALDALEKAENANSDAIARGIQVQRDLTSARRDAIPGAGDLAQSVRDLDSGYYALQQQEIENAKTQKDHTLSEGEKEQSSRDLASAENDLAVKVFETAGKYAEAEGAVKGTKREQDLMRDSLELSKAKFPELAAVIDGYIAKLLEIPTNINTTFGIDGKASVGGKFRALGDGGIVKASPGGTVVRVGEAGQDEVVVPLNSDGSMSGVSSNGGGFAGGPVTVNIIMPVGSNGDDVVRAIDKWRSRNGNAKWMAGAGGISGGTP